MMKSKPSQCTFIGGVSHYRREKYTFNHTELLALHNIFVIHSTSTSLESHSVLLTSQANGITVSTVLGRFKV